MSILPKHNQEIQPERKLAVVQNLVDEANAELAYMEILSRTERLELPRITLLNKPMVEEALTITQEDAEDETPEELERSIRYFHLLDELIHDVTILTEKLKSTHITIGARIYKRCKTIKLNRKARNHEEPIHFPLQPEEACQTRPLKKTCPKNEAIVVAHIEGI